MVLLNFLQKYLFNNLFDVPTNSHDKANHEKFNNNTYYLLDV